MLQNRGTCLNATFCQRLIPMWSSFPPKPEKYLSRCAVDTIIGGTRILFTLCICVPSLLVLYVLKDMGSAPCLLVCPRPNVEHRQIRKIIGFSFEKGGGDSSCDALKIQNLLIYLHDSSHHTIERYI